MSLNWFEPSSSSILFEMLLLWGLALVLTSIGFYRTVYFVSLGYVLSIAAMGILTPIRHLTHITWASALQNLLLVLWGLRLAVYLVRRESKRSYRKELKHATESFEGLTWLMKVPLWIGVSVFYAIMFSPSLFSLISSPAPSSGILQPVQILGLVTMGLGFVVESVADKQKSDFKQASPTQYCDVGLYQWVRYPNYLGEIVFWVGNWITAIQAYDTPFQWIVSVMGMVFIILIMIGSTIRLEKRHDEKYGDLSSYQDYVRTVPVLLPLVPIYRLTSDARR